MSYDNSSLYGDRVVDEYDDHNNFVGTFTPSGFLVYHLLGDGFDLMSEQCSQFMNDVSLISASASSLDKFWGVSYGMVRPKLPTSNRLLSDDEYRAYLYLRNCRLMTKEDLEIAFRNVFCTGALADYDVKWSFETNYLEVTDHPNYTPKTTDGSNIAKRDDDTSKHFITDFASDEDAKLIEGGLSVMEELITVIEIPSDNWDSEFLEYLQQFISVKGNVKIKEYSL